MSKENCPNCGDKSPYRNASCPDVTEVAEEKLFKNSELYRAMAANLGEFRNNKNERVKNSIGILLIALFPAASSILIGAFWTSFTQPFALSLVLSTITLSVAITAAIGTFLKWKNPF